MGIKFLNPIDPGVFIGATKTADFTFALADANTLITVSAGATTFAATIPTDANVPFPVGTRLWLTILSAGTTVAIAGDVGVTLMFSGDDAPLHIAGAWMCATKTSANSWTVYAVSGVSTMSTSISYSTAYTLGKFDYDVVKMLGGTDATVTIDASMLVVGKFYLIRNFASTNLTFAAAAGTTITKVAATLKLPQSALAVVYVAASNSVYLNGELAAS